MTRITPFSEDDLLSAVIELAHLRKWLVYHVRNSKAGVIQGDVGFPDLVMVKDGRLLFVELKRGKSQPSPAQWRWLDALDATGAETFVWRPQSWLSGAIDAVLA